MTTVTQAVEKRQAGPVPVMFPPKKQFAAVPPASVDVDAFLGTMAGALYTSEDLMKAAAASPDSLYTALMRCASLGHFLGTDEFYLVPRKRKGRPEVQGIEGYRGIVADVPLRRRRIRRRPRGMRERPVPLHRGRRRQAGPQHRRRGFHGRRLLRRGRV